MNDTLRGIRVEAKGVANELMQSALDDPFNGKLA